MDRQLELLLGKYPDLAGIAADIEKACALLLGCYRSGGMVLICGNGGSAADAEHLVGELMKGYLSPRPVPAAVRAALAAAFPDDAPYLAAHLQGALPTFSLASQMSLITAIANDTAADMIFAQQVYGYGRPGDVLVAISTSGNSPNILRAAQVARALGLGVLGFTGRSGGGLHPLCTVSIRVAADLTSDVQESHLALYHAICAIIEGSFFNDKTVLA